MQSFVLSSKSAQFLEYMELRTRTMMTYRHFFCYFELGYFKSSANSNMHTHPKGCKTSHILSFSQWLQLMVCSVRHGTRPAVAVTLMLCSHCSVHVSLAPTIHQSDMQPMHCMHARAHTHT